MERLVGSVGVRRFVALVAVVQLVTGVVAAFTVAPPELVAPVLVIPPPPPPAPVVAPVPAPLPVPGETDAALAAGPEVPLFDAAGAAQPFKALKNPTFEGVPLVLHVIEDQGAWLHVQVNTRPNGSTAWIQRSAVLVTRVPNRIVINLGARRLTVLHGNDVLVDHPVAIGAPSGPTPVGEFYIDATVHLANADGPYGVGQLSVSGFSEVYKSFGGGIGQIAIHGTNNPSAIGGTVSHGCVRMLNNDWNEVASLAPNGTPVSIRA